MSRLIVYIEVYDIILYSKVVYWMIIYRDIYKLDIFKVFCNIGQRKIFYRYCYFIDNYRFVNLKYCECDFYNICNNFLGLRLYI